MTEAERLKGILLRIFMEGRIEEERTGEIVVRIPWGVWEEVRQEAKKK